MSRAPASPAQTLELMGRVSLAQMAQMNRLRSRLRPLIVELGDILTQLNELLPPGDADVEAELAAYLQDGLGVRLWR